MALLVMVLLAAPARADDSSEAQELFQRAKLAYDLQHWDDALDRFQALYGARQDPAVLYNIAQCQRHLRRYEEAAISYRLFSSRLPNAPQTEQALQFARRMDEEAALARPPASMPEKSSPPIPAPAGSPTEVAPVRPVATEEANVVVRPAPPPPDRHRQLRLAGIGLTGLGASMVVAGAVFTAVSSQAADQAWHRDTYDYDADVRRASFRDGAIATFTVGGAVAVAGVTLWALGRHR